MSIINASITKMEEIEVFGIPALYTPYKVSHQTVHLGMYHYELQAEPEDWGQPRRLMGEVNEGFFGTVLTPVPVEGADGEGLAIGPEDFKAELGIGYYTPAEFEDKYLSPGYAPCGWNRFMEKRIDLLDFLSRVVLENTRAYQSDFEQDAKTLVQAAEESNMENRVFYWMSRPCGTWCVKEREVFLRDSEAYHIWTHYEAMPEGIRAYRVIVTGRQDGRIIGDVYPLHYREQVQRIRQAALPITTVEAAYPSGYIARMDFAEWEQCYGRLYERYGRPVRIRYAPESEAELTRAIMLEHRFQKGWKRKSHTKTPNPPSR